MSVVNLHSPSPYPRAASDAPILLETCIFSSSLRLLILATLLCLFNFRRRCSRALGYSLELSAALELSRQPPQGPQPSCTCLLRLAALRFIFTTAPLLDCDPACRVYFPVLFDGRKRGFKFGFDFRSDFGVGASAIAHNRAADSGPGPIFFWPERGVARVIRASPGWRRNIPAAAARKLGLASRVCLSTRASRICVCWLGTRCW